MNSPLLIVPANLRPEIIQRVEQLDDESLLVQHRALLLVEKERLWRELSVEAEADRRSGKFDRLASHFPAGFHRSVEWPERGKNCSCVRAIHLQENESNPSAEVHFATFCNNLIASVAK